jgi:glutamate synthase (ferredoxin)
LYYFFETVNEQNLKVLGWRDVPVDVSWDKLLLKRTNSKTSFYRKNGLELTEQQFNAKLFAARKNS